MSSAATISKQDLLDELEKVPPDQYLHLWVVIRQLQKKSFKSSKDALRNIFALEG